MITSESPLDRIGHSLLAGLRWNTIGIVAQSLVQLAATVVLARLLGPTPFGLVAIAWAIITPLGVLVDGGFGQSLVQMERLRDEEIAFCFWAQLFSALILAGVFCALAPVIADFFAEAAVVPILLAYSSVLILQGISGTSLSLMRRSLQFRNLQLIDLSAILAGNLLVALPLAAIGAGVWSLVASAIVVVGLQAVIAYSLTKHTLRLRPGDGYRRFLTLSPKYLLLSIVNVAGLATLPRLAIGHSFGPSTLGLFDRTYALIVAPIARLAAMVDSVLFPSHARLLERGHAKHAELYLASLTIGLLFALPVTVVLVANGPLIVEVLLGKQWIEAAALVAPLASLLPLYFAINVSVPVLNGLGRPGVELIVQLGVLALFIAGIVLLPSDARDVVWMLVAAHAIRTVCLVLCVARIIGIAARRILTSLLPGAVAAGALVAFDYAAQAMVPATLGSIPKLAVYLAGSGAVATVAYATWWKVFRIANVVRGSTV